MWSLDRRVAASAVVVAAFALAIPLVAADAPPPARPESSGDPIALAKELATLANRGAKGTWLVTFAFTRTNSAGSQLHSTIVSAQRGALSINGGFGSLVVTTAAGRTYSCTVVGAQPTCLSSSTPAATAHPGAVYGGAIVSGRYDIAGVPSPPIAGIAARCFALRLKAGLPIAGLGFSSEQCYSADGVPLRSRITRPGGTDEQVALTVRRTVGRDEILGLVEPYGLQRLAPRS